MKTLLPGLAGAVFALAACQTTPPSNPALENARSAVSNASNDPAVARAAQPELQRARDALVAAESSWEAGDDSETTSRAYVAKQRANIATEVGARYTNEQRLQELGAERERIRTEAREREAKLAQSRAEAATRQAAEATQQATTASRQAAAAQAQADAERQRANEQSRQLEAERESSARMQQDLQQLQAKATERGLVVTLQDVLFDSGKAQLRTGGVRSLEKVADVLKTHPERRVLVEGFTDSQGSDDYNVELSRRRAEAVKQQLQALGVPDQKVETRAYGEAYPVADNGTLAGRQQNRRVEILFSDAQGQFKAR